MALLRVVAACLAVLPLAEAAVSRIDAESTPIYAQILADWASPRGIKYIVSTTPIPDASSGIAWGTYIDSINSTGWATLEVHTNSSFSDDLQAYAAGYMEGAVSQVREYLHLSNICNGQTWDNGLGEYLVAQWEWMKTMVKENNATSSYWHHVGLMLDQQQGLYDGYNDYASDEQKLDWLDFYCGTLSGDLDDLTSVFPQPSMKQKSSDGHCSVLVKPIGDISAPTDLYIGHTTWGGFESMTRIYKFYDLPFTLGAGSSAQVPARRVAFSSYPATLFSDDDWYTTSAGLVVTETTIDNNNQSLWKFVVPQTVPDWARNMIANRLANSGASWAETFKQYNSGTYNNMFMVLDWKLFQPGKPLQPGLLYVFEQMPGPYFVYSDHTDYLLPTNRTYWASYNRIATPWLFNLTNQWELVGKYGQHFSYANTSRAQIFRRQYSSVIDETSFRKLMRYNDFEHDPIAVQGCSNNGRSASNAIAERGDLTPQNADCINDIGFQDEAALDLKYTTYSRSKDMSKSMSSSVIAGPTHDQQPVFSWLNTSLTVLDVPHAGQPDVWNFPYVEMQWSYAP